MKPDEPFNYWQNIPAVSGPIDPPKPAPVPAPQPIQPVTPVPAVQTSAPVMAVPTAASTVPTPQTVDPILSEPAPVVMYAPTEVSEPEMPNNVADEPIDDETDDTEDYEQVDTEPIHWAATESLAQEKNSLWFFVCILVVAGLIAFDIFMLKSYTFSALVVVMATALMVLNRRPPVEVNYTLSPEQGIYVGEVLHEFDEFKSFGVINDHGNNFVKLIPVNRFGIGVSVYFPVELGEQIVDMLGSVLPMEELKLDVFDIVVRKLRL